MKLARIQTPDGRLAFARVDGDDFTLLATGDRYGTLADVLDADDPQAVAMDLVSHAPSTCALDEVTLLPPIDQQEVWAAGVTYRRSQAARTKLVTPTRSERAEKPSRATAIHRKVVPREQAGRREETQRSHSSQRVM